MQNSNSGILSSPELIVLQSKDCNGYKKALHQLLSLTYRFDEFDDFYFFEHPITLVRQENTGIIPYENYILESFVVDADAFDELHPDLHHLIHNLALSDLTTDEGWLFRSLIIAYALHNKDHIRFYIEYLRSIDTEGESEEFDDIESLVQKYGWCKETLHLIIGRLIDYTGQFGIIQFSEHASDDLGKWLSDTKNYDVFYSIFIKILVSSSYNDEHAKYRTREAANALYGKGSVEADKWFETTMSLYHEQIDTIYTLNSECNDILTEKVSYDQADALYEKIRSLGNKELDTKFSAICYSRANIELAKVCGDKIKPLTDKTTALFQKAEEWILLSMQYSYVDDEYNFPYMSRAKKIRQMVILYQNWGRAYLKSGDSVAEIESKEKFYTEGLTLLEKGFIYDHADEYCAMNYSFILYMIFASLGSTILKEKFAKQLEYLDNILTSLPEDPKYFGLYCNANVLFGGMHETEKCYDCLEKAFKANQTLKQVKLSDFNDKEIDYLREEPRFKALVKKYFK